MEGENGKKTNRSFGSRFCHALDIPLFTKKPFKGDNYLIYAVEKSLITLADGFVDTYASNKTRRGIKLMGSLTDMKCGKEDKMKIFNQS